ncbi:MAG TPA: hypothetical protein VF221_11140 [Chloroflexota bacterium]
MSDRTSRMFDEAEDRMAEVMREMHERGDLRHLHGRPLDLEEDDPAWLVTRMLKQEGFSHPLLERRNEVEGQVRAADSLIERVLERRARLLDPQSAATPAQAAAFNRGREFALADYRKRLAELNRSIRDFNITVPTALQVNPVQIDRQLGLVEEKVPPLDVAQFPNGRERPSLWSRILRGHGSEVPSRRER